MEDKRNMGTGLRARDVRCGIAIAVVACAVALLGVFALHPGAHLAGMDPASVAGKEAAAADAVAAPPVSAADVPAYGGSPSVAMNGDEPYFDPADFPETTFEAYSPLDARGRCGACAALVGPETMPTEERGPIGEVKPTGWRISKYDWIDGRYLYNRCHLLGYQLTAENANPRNLITGTRFMNVQGMQPYEDEVAYYVHRTGNHVLYRVTPLFAGDDALARGVLMEAQSVEDGGAGVSFCAFCYNVQPGVEIDYATGQNASDGTIEQVWQDWDSYDAQKPADAAAGATAGADVTRSAVPDDCTYVLNQNSRKFHLPTCSAVEDMSERNKGYFTGTRDQAIEAGYAPCKLCNP